MGINVDIAAVLEFITEQLHYLFGDRITSRLFSEYVIIFEETFGTDSDGNMSYRTVGILRMISDRQIEVTTEDSVFTIIRDKALSYNQIFRFWYAVYSWR